MTERKNHYLLEVFVMKHLLLSASFFLINMTWSARAQPYSHYLDYTTQWNEHAGGCLVYCYGYNYHSYISGDTLINNTWYFKVSSCIDGMSTGPSLPVMLPDSTWKWYSDTTRIDTTQLLGCLREDAQKRFYYIPAGDAAESLLFDFDLAIGSSFPGGYSCVVESIDTIYFAGEPRKVFNTNGSSIIEGIGNFGGILNHEYFSCGTGIEFGGTLSCYKNQCDSISFSDYYVCSFCKTTDTKCLPESDFIFSADTICANACIHFADKSNRQPTAWHWTFEGATMNTYEGQHPPGVCYADTGTFSVTLVAENRFGADSIAKNIHVRVQECHFCLYVPNAFSPNGDGVNDFFGAISVCPVAYYNLKIFNRWGAKVFETASIEEQWDGRDCNKLLLPGNYLYRIIYQSLSTLPAEVETGSVVLIR